MSRSLLLSAVLVLASSCFLRHPDRPTGLWAKYEDCQTELAGALAAQEVEHEAADYAHERVEYYANLLAELEAAPQSESYTVELREGNLVVQLSSAVLFDSGAVELKESGKEVLASLVPFLQKDDRKILLGGHTDDVPVAPSATRYTSNMELSALRGIAAFNYLSSEGVDPGRMAAAAYGPHHPRGDNETEEGRATNRRLEIILLPTPEELEQIHAGPRDTEPAQ